MELSVVRVIRLQVQEDEVFPTSHNSFSPLTGDVPLCGINDDVESHELLFNYNFTLSSLNLFLTYTGIISDYITYLK